MRKKETDTGRRRRRKNAIYMDSKKDVYILIHTRNKIKIDTVIDERGKAEVLKWMREVKKLREAHRRGIETVN